MLGFFLRCLGCDQPLGQKTRALCRSCELSLVRCPPLCSKCGSPVCPTKFQSICIRPWVSQMRQEQGGIHSYSGKYLLVAQGYQVLKKWKTYRGPVFDRQVLILDALLLETWKGFGAEAVVPIPQGFFRSWKRRGSRTEVIAGWVGASVGLPVFCPLEMSVGPSFKRQGERTLEERLGQRRNPYQFKDRLKQVPKSVILVDDFMTTGRTLNYAAAALRNLGVVRIHAFCLGVRVLRSF